jgi:hypothetical protein
MQSNHKKDAELAAMTLLLICVMTNGAMAHHVGLLSAKSAWLFSRDRVAISKTSAERFT